jgi:hypothetical protein
LIRHSLLGRYSFTVSVPAGGSLRPLRDRDAVELDDDDEGAELSTGMDRRHQWLCLERRGGEPGGSRRKGCEHLIVGVLVDHRGTKSDDFAALCELVHEEAMEVVNAWYGDVHDHVVAASDDIDRADLRQASGIGLERLDDRPAEGADLEVDKRLDVTVQGGRVDSGVVAGDDPAGAQCADTFQAGRRSDAEGAGEVAVGLPRIALQMPDDRRIKFVHAASMTLAPNSIRLIAPSLVGTASFTP